MIPFYLVTGFLGSGKTTLLKNILRDYAESKRIAIIQNEFAPTGTDGKELQREGRPFKLVEVNNGSVFCVCMLGTFIQTLKKLIEDYEPELIFLEASGLSDPINIIELLQEDAIREKLALSKIFCVVDAVNFDKGLKRVTRFRHQIMIADDILLNKTDLYDGDLQELRDRLSQLNPFAKIINTHYCMLDMDKFLENVEDDHRAAITFGRKESQGRPSMNASVLRIHNKISREGLHLFVKELMPECPRIKGFVNTTDNRILTFQSVFDIFDIEEIDSYLGPTEIVAFGDNISPGYLRKTFIKYT
ncbi:MAG: CobW family GTP-binding protein [Bacteroidales bacterium]